MFRRHPYVPKAEQEDAQPPAPPPLPPYPDDLEISPLVPPNRTPPPPESPIMYGAPPSRNATPGGYSERPGVYRLSPQEAEIASLAGISPQEYVKHRLRLEREKKQGFRQNG